MKNVLLFSIPPAPGVGEQDWGAIWAAGRPQPGRSVFRAGTPSRAVGNTRGLLLWGALLGKMIQVRRAGALRENYFADKRSEQLVVQKSVCCHVLQKNVPSSYIHMAPCMQ